MTDNTQPDALRQAAWLKREGASCQRHYDLGVLIERLHAENEALRTQQPAPTIQQDPTGWYVTGCSRLLDEDDAKAEARHIGGTARAIPLYTAPQPFPLAQPAPAAGAVAGSVDQWQKRHPTKTEGKWENTDEADAKWWRDNSPGWEVRALYAAAPTPPAQAADSVLEDAARYRWLREGNDAKHGAAWHVAVNLYGFEWDAAIDAAMNKGANHD